MHSSTFCVVLHSWSLATIYLFICLWAHQRNQNVDQAGFMKLNDVAQRFKPKCILISCSYNKPHLLFDSNIHIAPSHSAMARLYSLLITMCKRKNCSTWQKCSISTTVVESPISYHHVISNHTMPSLPHTQLMEVVNRAADPAPAASNVLEANASLPCETEICILCF